jgi:hypothetical protein
MKSSKLILAAAAMGGLLAGANSRVSAASTVSSPVGSQMVSNHSSNQVAKASIVGKAGVQFAADEKGKHDCKGKNECKGQGGCKTGDNGCKGKNTCKGHGGCKSTGEGNLA